MKNLFIRSALAALFFVFFTSKAFAGFNPPEKYLVEYKLRYSYSVDSLKNFWKKKRIPSVITGVHNAVDMYEITYKGLWIDSSFIIAKGVLYVPKLDKPMAEMVYCHGTRISLEQGYGIQDDEQLICMMHATDGYVAMFPFYYGLGGGEKEHVYHDAWSESMSVIYMIKACRELLPQLGKQTTGQLFVTGYSQGGHASMATHKMLESGNFPEIQLTASSPMAGAYDLTGVQAKTMFEHYDRPHYLPYLLISYQYAYHVIPGDVYSVFKPPFDKDIPKYFAQPRTVDYGYLDKILPKVPKDMISDSLVEVFRTDTNFVFTKMLKKNSLYNWVPKAPMQLCACKGDNEVLYQNTEVAYAYMHQRTDQVHLKLFGKYLAHNPCAPFAIIYTKYFFDNIREGKKHITKVPFGKRFLLSIAIAQGNSKGRKIKRKTGGNVQNYTIR
ncbi:MAG: hypothetical protein SFW35_01915 [Chitinophagales bacterium]|nr:hypothetical protein [Chitinophagales bacterium]